ncbi:MBL fold metallo-hydrolase [Candidatus Daviesbacteria bacterium]|nr:MBL fold metallo-hydrolase [Candidatus Daviesbacteria bacterium]
MDIYWYGQAFFKIKGKNTSIMIDPFYSDFTGLKLPKDMIADIAIKTHNHKDHSNLEAVLGDPVKIEGPGEYEIKGVAVAGVSVFHDKENGAQRGKNTVYNINIDGLNIVHLGDLGHILTESQIEDIGKTDILMVPVGSIFTIDAKDAQEVVSQLEPQIIIPMHYATSGLKFELEPVDKFLKEMGTENPEALNKLTVTKDKLPAEPQIIVLNKS